MPTKGTNGADARAADEATETARAAAAGGVPGLIASMAEKVGATARVGAVFGEPVERDGLTVIPVAQAMWGSGAGGGALTRPLGYIEMTSRSATFVPLQKPWQDAKLVLAWALGAWLLARAIRLLLRR